MVIFIASSGYLLTCCLKEVNELNASLLKQTDISRSPNALKSYPDDMNKKSLEQRPDMTRMTVNKSTQKGKPSIFYKINTFYKNQIMSFDPFTSSGQASDMYRTLDLGRCPFMT